jgi:hypothetical protein
LGRKGATENISSKMADGEMKTSSSHNGTIPDSDGRKMGRRKIMKA